MTISISNSISIPPLTTANSSPNSTTHNTQQAQPATPPPTDTVKLSEWQQVHQLHNQGQRVSQIAATLRLPVAIVNNYLGITSS